jgi:hypothetical protein
MKAAILLFAFFVSSRAFACGCDAPDRPEDVRYFVHIFKGEVVDVRTESVQDPSHKIPRFKLETVTFKILEMIKGPTAKVVIVEFGGATSCDLEEPAFRSGDVYLISTSDIFLAQDSKNTDYPEKLKPSGRYRGNFCNLRVKVK